MSTAVDPYLVLADLDVRCRQGGASNAPRMDEQGDGWSGVAFILNGVRMVAPLGEVTAGSGVRVTERELHPAEPGRVVELPCHAGHPLRRRRGHRARRYEDEREDGEPSHGRGRYQGSRRPMNS